MTCLLICDIYSLNVIVFCGFVITENTWINVYASLTMKTSSHLVLKKVSLLIVSVSLSLVLKLKFTIMKRHFLITFDLYHI
jgi:hypothetical protein